jgi:hypothetical protein
MTARTPRVSCAVSAAVTLAPCAETRERDEVGLEAAPPLGSTRDGERDGTHAVSQHDR